MTKKNTLIHFESLIHSFLLKAPSIAPSISPSSYVIAYPSQADPLLVATEPPFSTAWLPTNAEQDYAVIVNPKSGKEMVSSPSLGFSAYVLGLTQPFLKARLELSSPSFRI